MRRRIGIVLLVALAVGLVAAARDLEGVTLPDRVTVADRELVLNGMGVRIKKVAFIGVKVYVAGLYLPAKEADPAKILAADEPRQLVMQFVYKEVEREKLVEAWNEGFQKNSPALLAAHPKEIAQFNALWGTMKAGDRAVLTYLPGQGLRVEGFQSEGPKKQWAETIAGKEFADMVFAIWLGKEPPNPELKKGLLGP